MFLSAAAKVGCSTWCFSVGPIWARMGPYGPIWTHIGPYGPIWAHMGPDGPVWALMGPYGPIWALMGPYGAIWAHMGPCGPIWANMGPNPDFETQQPSMIVNELWSQIFFRIFILSLKKKRPGPGWGPYGPIWAHMGPYMGPYRPLWVLLDRSWKIPYTFRRDFWTNFAGFGSKTCFLMKFLNDSASFLLEKLKNHVILTQNLNIL